MDCQKREYMLFSPQGTALISDLGEAAEKGIWEFDTDLFLPLKVLLRIL